MHRSLVTLAMPWLIGLGLALIAAVIARGFWLYRASLTWPTADGVITRIDIARKSSGGSPSGHYFSATFTYNFRDPSGAASPAIGAKIFQTRRKREPLQIANWPSTRKVSLDSIQEVPFKTISNSIRGLIWVTGQPALTFNVADAAAYTLS